MQAKRFQHIVFEHYAKHGRTHLPWRLKPTPYRVLVSEIMLQQTQVERVIPYFSKWMRQYPTIGVLASASLGDVLRSWQGLGYPRRAKMLHAAAQEVVRVYKGRIPRDVSTLESLPGIGAYTAAAVAAFAYNEDVIVIETNIRTAIFHHYFETQETVSDAEVRAVLEDVLPRGNAREWYGALMDYGAHLKKQGIHLNTKSATHARQSKFNGSAREARGAILKALVPGRSKNTKLLHVLGLDRADQVQAQLLALEAEGFITKTRGYYQLPS